MRNGLGWMCIVHETSTVKHTTTPNATYGMFQHDVQQIKQDINGVRNAETRDELTMNYH